MDRLWRKYRIRYGSLYFPYGFEGPGGEFFPGRGTIVSNGPIGGAQIGYNYQTPWRVVLGIEVEAEASGVGGNLKITCPSTSGDISTKVSLYGAFRARFGYAFERFLVLDNVMIYIALGGAFGSFSDKMEAEVGPAFISYNQSTTRFEVSKAVGAFEQRIRSPQISLYLSITGIRPSDRNGRMDARSISPAATFGTRCMYHLVRVGANWKFDLGM